MPAHPVPSTADDDRSPAHAPTAPAQRPLLAAFGKASPATSARPALRSAWALAAAVAFLAACSNPRSDGGGTTTGNGGGAAKPAHTPATVAVDGLDPAGAVGAPAVDARAYAVYDVATSRTLASDQADGEVAVGSLMKLLNARVAYDAGEPDREVEVPGGIGGEAGESVIGIAPGQTFTRGVLIRAMLKVSANDAARLLAIDIAGSEEDYAVLMNEAAAELGLDGTAAVNATGLDADGQHSTAADLVALGVDLLRDPAFAETVADPDASLNGQTFPNTNDLLDTYDGADGIKTGHTTDAGWCLLASATRDGRQVVVAVLGAPSEEARNDAATRLLDWAFTQP